MGDKKLTRIPTQGQIAGVCAGLAKYFDIDVTLMRVGFVVATVLSGGGFAIAYLILAVVMPVEQSVGSPTHSADASSDDYIKANVDELKHEFSGTDRGTKLKNYFGLGLVLLGLWLLVGQWFPDLVEIFSWKYLLPLGLIVIGIYVATRKDA